MASRIPILSGYTRIKGDKARRYRDPNGKIISRRKYEDERLRREGWESWTDYQKIKKSDEWLRLEGIYTDKQGIKRRDVGPTSEFSKKYLALRHARKSHSQDLHDPDGPLADWLVLVGIKEEGADWDISSDPSLTH